MVQQACIIALHRIFSTDTWKTSSSVAATDISVADSSVQHHVPCDHRCCSKSASLRLSPSLRPSPGLRLSPGSCLVAGSEPVLCADREQVDGNNNIDECSNIDGWTHRNTLDSIPAVTGPALEPGGTSPAATACQEFPSHPLDFEEDEQNGDEASDVLSDMSIDVDNEDLDGGGLIYYVAGEVEAPTASEGQRCDDLQPSCSVSVAQTSAAPHVASAATQVEGLC